MRVSIYWHTHTLSHPATLGTQKYTQAHTHKYNERRFLRVQFKWPGQQQQQHTTQNTTAAKTAATRGRKNKDSCPSPSCIYLPPSLLPSWVITSCSSYPCDVYFCSRSLMETFNLHESSRGRTWERERERERERGIASLPFYFSHFDSCQDEQSQSRDMRHLKTKKWTSQQSLCEYNM